ncbi:hypothetical protein PPL_11067 [Heterostelium album PN500]|uniref:Ankyrin repeat-containing protein n=1 Tax=Heterostelium pallidum (strain ATCC 26659 / Pp 5 / PN500) TaxID=670386 RepID=D3BSU7_HETP5|nr:hypothetical protein PPL_11067 [Heterostelium album PN500]EFA75562.1 hypothetical protein PPL_11067 [Heterostelium album PN500]|eukprot:XP_020427696.1 hypothetical protein PPL_11067 [Heterostelium album PN500]
MVKAYLKKQSKKKWYNHFIGRNVREQNVRNNPLTSLAAEASIKIDNLELFKFFIEEIQVHIHHRYTYMCLAISLGRFAFVKYIDEQTENKSILEYPNVLYSNPIGLNLEMIEWLANFNYLAEHGADYIYVKTVKCAALEGRLDFIESVVRKGHLQLVPETLEAITSNAAKGGHIQIVQWLLAMGNVQIPVNIPYIDSAAISGHLETVKFLHSNGIGTCTTAAMDECTRNGHFQVLKWLHGNRSEGCTTRCMDNAAYSNNLDIVKWLHFNRSEGCTTSAIDCGAAKDLELIKWLLENRSEGFTESAIYNAAHSNKLENVKYLHSKGGNCYPKTIFTLFKNAHSHLDVIQYLFDHRMFEPYTTLESEFDFQFKIEIIRNVKDNPFLRFLAENETILFSTSNIDNHIEYADQINCFNSESLLKEVKLKS